MINQFKFMDAVPSANPELNFDIELEPDKQVYCFIGKNAVGKTKMLETLARTLLYCHVMFDDYSHQFLTPRNTQSSSAYSSIKPVISEVIKDKVLNLPNGKIMLNNMVLEEEIPLPPASLNDLRPTSYTNIRRSPSIPLNRINRVIAKMTDSTYTMQYPMIFIGARGRGYIDEDAKNGNNIPLPGNAAERFSEAFNRFYLSINTEEVKGIEVISWFKQRIGINPDYVDNYLYFQNEAKAVLELMQKLEPNRKLVYIDKSGEEKLAASIKDKKLYIDNIPAVALSTGYASIVRLFQEIIAGYGAWQSVIDSKTPVLETKGVVFIDEIEAHLHAEWQSKIIPLLKESFPNTTFYIATHSPMVVATTEENESYELERGKDNIIRARNLGSPHDWYLSDLYNNGFHVNLDKVKKTTARKEKPLTDLITEFSDSVQQFKRTRTEASKKSAEKLYALITKRIPLTDPRRTTIDTLKGTVQ